MHSKKASSKLISQKQNLRTKQNKASNPHCRGLPAVFYSRIFCRRKFSYPPALTCILRGFPRSRSTRMIPNKCNAIIPYHNHDTGSVLLDHSSAHARFRIRPARSFFGTPTIPDECGSHQPKAYIEQSHVVDHVPCLRENNRTHHHAVNKSP